MKLINSNVNTLIQRLVEYLQDNILLQQSSYAYSTGSTAGSRNTKQVYITADFPADFYDDDGTLRYRSDLPAIAVSMYEGGAANSGLGTIVGTDKSGRRVLGMYGNFQVELDIWAISPKQRDMIASEIMRLMWRKRRTVARNLGIQEILMTEMGERGFDLTDRILQYQSHQITKVWRRLLTFRIITEIYEIAEDDCSDFTYDIIEISLGDYTTYSGYYLPELFEEYLKDRWDVINMRLLR